ncbi:ATP-binding protein [Enterococcus faecium]
MNINNHLSTNFIIGSVREIKGTSVIIRLFENTSQLVHFYEGERYSGVIIGSYVGIVRGQYIIVGKVEKEYAYDKLNDSSYQIFKKDRFVREIEVKIIGSFKGNDYTMGMVAFPQIFNDVILLSENQKRRIIIGNENKGKNLDDDLPKMSIGKVWPDGIRLNIKWYRLFNSHIAIFGNTGSGKSNTLAKLYHELYKMNFKDNSIELGNSRFIILDFNGEYVGRKTITEHKKVYNLSTNGRIDNNFKQDNRNYISIPEQRFWDKDMLSVLFGATEQTQQPFLNRVLTYYFKKDRDFKINLKRYIAEAFYNTYISSNNNSLDLLKRILELLSIDNAEVSDWIANTLYNSTNESFYSKVYLDGWACKKFYYWDKDENILEREKQNVLTKLEAKQLDLDNPMKNLQIACYLKMIYELRYHTVQYDHIAPLLHRIEARVNDFSKIFKVVSRDQEIFDDTVSVVSFKSVNQDMKMLVPMIIAKMTYEMNKEMNNNRDRVFNLIIDEAHNILSETSTRESEKWKDYRLEVFEEIIKEGRKFGYFLTLASQRPADISPTIVSQIHNYFIHRLVNDNDLRLLDRTMTSLDRVSKESIPNLSPGQLILTGVLFELPTIIQIDQLETELAPNSDNIPLVDIWRKKN